MWRRPSRRFSGGRWPRSSFRRTQRMAVLAEAGVPAEVATALLGMYDALAGGRIAREHGTEHRRGTVSLINAIERLVDRVMAAA